MPNLIEVLSKSLLDELAIREDAFDRLPINNNSLIVRNQASLKNLFASIGLYLQQFYLK